MYRVFVGCVEGREWVKQVAFVSVSYAHREALSAYMDGIVATLEDYAVEPFIFVDAYIFSADDARQMMETSCKDIQRSAFVIAEASHKAVGVGVEVGYARGLGKPVIYMRHQDAEHSTTLAGIATHTVIYGSVAELKTQLGEAIQDILS